MREDENTERQLACPAPQLARQRRQCPFARARRRFPDARPPPMRPIVFHSVSDASEFWSQPDVSTQLNSSYNIQYHTKGWHLAVIPYCLVPRYGLVRDAAVEAALAGIDARLAGTTFF